jgi:coenzyme PQQ precursor peptide PqqA
VALMMRHHLQKSLAEITWETSMTWKTPKIVEVPVGMEINMYVCATRK